MAFIYAMPNHKAPQKRHEKGVSLSEFKLGIDRLLESGEFTRKWFAVHLPACAKEGGCNFTIMGSVFVMLGFAIYASPGIYMRCLDSLSGGTQLAADQG